ncbi:MAG: hypothetical protein HWN65_06990 [Candidatus Helarchaeota archaeon]|nr:hypothetical protein [Candidatus Helarchaeota archaeon]
MASEIIFYGGIDQIGGNKILIKDSGESFFFDFGVSFEDQGRFFAEFLKPRGVKGIGDYLAFGLIPEIPCLYRTDLSSPTNFPCGKPPVDGVFLSHAHVDHFGYVCFIEENVPIYGSEITNKIIESYETVGTGGIEKEYIKMKKRPYGNYVSRTKWPDATRHFYKWADYKGAIQINFFDVDHSIWGAGGYEIDLSDRNVIFTGDFRQHGNRKDLTKNSLKKLETKDIDILIIEGTNVGNEAEEQQTKTLIETIIGKPLSKKLASEEELKEKALTIIQPSKSPVFVDFGIRDFDRFKTFYEIAQECDRKLVIPIKLAKHLDDLQSIIGIGPSDGNLLIYHEPKGLGSYDERDFYKKWERPLYKLNNVKRSDELLKELDTLIIFMDYFHMKNLVDLKPAKGIYIHSTTEPFSEEAAVDFRRHLEWIKLFNLDYHYLHVSGHMSAPEIFEVIDNLAPKQIIPIHTKGTEIFKKRYPNVIIPQKGQKIDIS